MGSIINCHTHIFTFESVPKNFLPFGIVRLLSQYRIGRSIGRFLNRLNPKSNNDLFDRFATFINVGNKKSQLEIFNLLRMFYPENSKFIVLSMDMEYMGAGKVPMKFEAQLDELSHLKKAYPDTIYPFICVDPRRPNVSDLVKIYVENHNFGGIKLYPPLGYYPFDRRLYPIYEYALSHDIPIISHCSPPAVFYRGKIESIHPITGESLPQKNRQLFVDRLTHPDNYEHVLKDFPDLKICLAHFGGGCEWEKYLQTPWEKGMEKCWFSTILDLIKNHDNVYADVSYTLHDIRLLPLLKVILQDQKLRSRILYGSDFYMTELGLSERSFGINLRAYLDELEYWQISSVNPQVFLHTK